MRKGNDKLKKFAEIAKMPHVFQNLNWLEPVLTNSDKKVVDYKGKWHSDFFKNDNPIVLELACGYAEYTVAIAERFPNKNVIGIDMKGNRLWTGAKYLMQNNHTNAAFIRSNIDLLYRYFDENEVSEIWIPFADPQRKKQRKCLTAELFLPMYRKILKPEGCVHLKTDSDLLYEYTLEMVEKHGLKVLKNYPDLYSVDFENELLNVKTRYEKQNPSGSDTIKYLQFTF
ncbi:MAG: tRNA (guanosine(46)-N7)-methyltransferase TrmB [Chitinophagales bacterium]